MSINTTEEAPDEDSWDDSQASEEDDAPRPTLEFVCRQPLPKFIVTFKPKRPNSTFYVPPILTLYKDALDSYRLENPTQDNLPTLVTRVSGLVDDVYEQFQNTFSEKLAQRLDESCWDSWRQRETKRYSRQGCWPRCPTGATFAYSLDCLLIYICNQLSQQDPYKYEFLCDLGLEVSGMFSFKNLEAECTVLVVELKATCQPSIIIETYNWVGDGRHLDYEFDFEDSTNAIDTPQMTTQKLIASMTSKGVTKALLMDSEFYCFARLVPFEAPSDGHFLVLSKVVKLHHDEDPPLFGTLVAMLFDRNPKLDFQISWPAIQPPLVQQKTEIPALLSTDLGESRLATPYHSEHNACEDFSLASDCRVWLDDTASFMAPLKLFRIQPSVYPWDKELLWPDLPNPSFAYPTPDSRTLNASLGKKLGHGRSGTVYQLQNKSLIAKFAVYDDYQECPTMAIESVHIEAALYETLLVPLQGRIVPRYYGMFSNHSSKIGNHRMLVLEDCGNTLGKVFESKDSWSPIDRDIRSEVCRLIDEIIDCGVDYGDVAPRNICVGVDGHSLRVIDFDACRIFPDLPDLRAKAQLEAKGLLRETLCLPDTTAADIFPLVLNKPESALIGGKDGSQDCAVDKQQSVCLEKSISLPQNTHHSRSNKRKRSISAPL